MFAVVEWFTEDGQKVHTCISHRKNQRQAEQECDLLTSPMPGGLVVDRAFTYQVVEFELGEPCPMCKRNFEF